jgi:hypothetical protein
VRITFQLLLGQSTFGLGAGGGGIVGENVICPLRGVMFCTGPVTFDWTTGWPGLERQDGEGRAIAEIDRRQSAASAHAAADGFHQLGPYPLTHLSRLATVSLRPPSCRGLSNRAEWAAQRPPLSRMERTSNSPSRPCSKDGTVRRSGSTLRTVGPLAAEELRRRS